MSIVSTLQNSKIIGDNLAGALSGKGISNIFNYSTPVGGNIIPEATLTKGQKMFSTNAENPNLPKPKTLYFVYFNLNPELSNKIQYKQQLVRELSGKSIDGSDINASAQTSTSMGEKVSSFVTSKLSSLSKSLGLSKELENATGSGSTNKKYSIPRLQSSTVADFIPDKDLFVKLSYEMSKLVKGYDKPSVSFETSELNEYNRKRIIYNGVKYGDVNITFFDVKDNPVQQFFTAYLKFICGDFLCKDKNIWESPIETNNFMMSESYKTVDGNVINPTYVGNLNTFGLNIDSNFRLINSISFCEYYMDRMLVYTIENPVVTSIKWGDGKMGDFSSNDIQVTFKYEGITNDLIDVEPYNVSKWDKNVGNNTAYVRYMVNKEIKKEVATFLQTNYSTATDSILSDITSILKGYMNGDTKFSWNTLKNQALDTARKYGLANEANTIAQTEQTLKNYNSKDSSGKVKYLINMATDPTSVIGKISASTNSTRGNMLV